MGGTIGVTSQPDKGSTFWFTTLLKTQPNGQHFERTSPNFDGLRVLIVDDNATNRRLLHHQLRNWKMADESVENGIEAIN